LKTLVLGLPALLASQSAFAIMECAGGDGGVVTANIVALDQPVMFNRLGAANVNGMIYSLERDVVTLNAKTVGGVAVPAGTTFDQARALLEASLPPLSETYTQADRDAALAALVGELSANIGTGTDPETGAIITTATSNMQLRPDKRPRPLVLRVAQCDRLNVKLTNLLTPQQNPIRINDPLRCKTPADAPVEVRSGMEFRCVIAEQVPNPLTDRRVSFHSAGMEYVTGPGNDDGAFVGNNADSTVPRGGSHTYNYFARAEGAYMARGMATVVGSDANQGNSSNLLFGQVIVEPKNSAIYRGQITEEEMRLASTGTTADGHPILNYEATYPATNTDGTSSVWAQEGKAGLPIMNTIQNGEIVHQEINAFVAYGPGHVMAAAPDGPHAGKMGHFPKATYPLESVGLRNPTVPNRLEPFRDFASVWHDEPATKQAFPGFYEPTVAGGSDVFNYVLAGVKDGFMINYGSGGIGSEIIANRLGVGPMHDCLTCAYEEFFLTSYTVGDPAQLVDIPANLGLEHCTPTTLGTAACIAPGPKANKPIFTEDPANIHHSYIGDFTKFRNTHVGKEQHVFHLHNHQWLYNPNDDNSNYLDAQGVGPGVGYTYEINFGGSGNRNKSAGDAIFHCHFYPHFAQGMWYHWRHHDVFEAGTNLVVSGGVGSYHTQPFALYDGTPATGARALPDGELASGVPIPAVVPLPGKPLAPMPGAATVVAKGLMVPAGLGNAAGAGTPVPVGSVAQVARPLGANPGYPFWVAGIEDIVGQRPPTPPLDMLSHAQAQALAANGPDSLWGNIDPDQADGWDGGLPRAALEGKAAGGLAVAQVHQLDFTKVVTKAQAVFYPEEGTDVEKLAMQFHAQRCHDTFLPDGTAATCSNTDTIEGPNGAGSSGGFIVNGGKPSVGAAFHEPCIDDRGYRMNDGYVGNFFSGNNGFDTRGRSLFSAENPRIYKGTNIQYDAVLNKAGYHYPQQRIITLWQDAMPVINKEKPGQPLVLRLNTFDCAVYHHSNLVPEVYEVDDYQVRTPTDIIGQHIHLPKWDLTTTDGAANGWNYEDGTLSPGAVRERIEALNCAAGHLESCHHGATAGGITHTVGAGSEGFTVPAEFVDGHGHPKAHPYFGQVAGENFGELFLGARTTIQRWFADPVVNAEGDDRGLGIIFTHDHYGPSTHQQIGLYATVLIEPAGSKWLNNESGAPTGYDPVTGAPSRTFLNADGRTLSDGGPTAWQAAILPPDVEPTGSTVGASELIPFREFYFEFSDFQHAYEPGVYVGADQLGRPLHVGPDGKPGHVPTAVTPVYTLNTGNPDWAAPLDANAFRFAINPPNRETLSPVFPDVTIELAGGINPRCPSRPCPQAIDVEDPGMFVANYRNEPLGLRIFDNLKVGRDGVKGTQADGVAGDLAFAMANKDADGNIILRQYKLDATKVSLNAAPTSTVNGKLYKHPLNYQPKKGDHIYGTRFPDESINNIQALSAEDPFTPQLRAVSGDLIKVKIQAGGHEEEHNAALYGLKWLQAGSGHGSAPNSGWRNAQAAGISEQFTLTMPVLDLIDGTAKGSAANTNIDYAYNIDASHDGWFSGTWGILRVYGSQPNDGLVALPGAAINPVLINDGDFIGPCKLDPNSSNRDRQPLNPRNYDVTAVLANEVMGKPAAININDICAAGSLYADQCRNGVGHEAAFNLNGNGGTLVYNSRPDSVTGPNGTFQAPIHDPTAILYVRTGDLELADTALTAGCVDTAGKLTPETCRTAAGKLNLKLKASAPVEPLVLRAAAGECLQVTLRNALPPMVESATAQTVSGGLVVTAPAGSKAAQQSNLPDMANLTQVIGAVKRDRFVNDNQVNEDGVLITGASTFNLNHFRPSAYISLGAALVERNDAVDAGYLVGRNTAKTNNTLIPPGASKLYRWYAGRNEVVDMHTVSGKGKKGTKTEVTIANQPIELGGANLFPADPIKQGEKSLVGQLVIEPQGSTWVEDADTRAQATVCPTGEALCDINKTGAFRDFSVVFSKALTHHYADSYPVGHMNGEGEGKPEDSQESSGMAINYGVEPLWFRAGIAPESHFGGPDSYGSIEQYNLYTNARVGDDPQTPVFRASAGKPFRMRVTNPYGTSRGTTFQLHGHVWQRDPYLCPGEAMYNMQGFGYADGEGNHLAGACLSDDGIEGNNIGDTPSRAIGNNPLGFYQGGQESITPSTHFDIVLPKAGGEQGNAGDYLFRDSGSFGNASGLWGILRVEP